MKKERTWFKSCSYMNGILNNILLLRQCVESNPGPVMHKSNVSVRTYNSNDLGVTDKFRRILVKLRNEVGSGGIVLLQETHIKNQNIIDSYWKGGYVHSCIRAKAPWSWGLVVAY